MKDSRQLKRENTNVFFGIHDRSTNQFVGSLGDMTTEGFRLRSKGVMETNKIFHFKMDLPYEIKGCKEITFDAMSVWSKNCAGSDEYDTGFQLQNVSPKSIELIEILIQGPLFKELKIMFM